jgi:hypothetical protein
MRVSTLKEILLRGCLSAALLPCAPAFAQQASRFRSERFDEDWRASESDFKDIAVGENVSLSLGGDARWRFSWLDSPRLGLGGANRDDWVLQRLLLHADLHFDDDARVFVQLGAHDGIGRDISSTSDDDQLDLQQAFVDVHAEVAGGRAMLRLGRQELALGPRFATTRDSGNIRQRHDMARLTYDRGHWRLDAFAGRPVAVANGSFDDNADQGQEFYGVRLERRFGDAATLDAYAYELDRRAAALAGVTARDDRVSLGARLFGRSGDLDYDAEVVHQTGTFGALDIRAVGAAFDVGRRWPDAPLKPRLGARVTYGSGDSDLADNTEGTFSPAFASSSWFGQNGLATFSNTVEVAATLNLSPREDVSVSLKAGGLWRAETADFVYGGSTALAGTSGGNHPFVGASPSALLVWRASEHVIISPYVSYVFIDDELKARGANDVRYVQLGVNLRF